MGVPLFDTPAAPAVSQNAPGDTFFAVAALFVGLADGPAVGAAGADVSTTGTAGGEGSSMNLPAIPAPQQQSTTRPTEITPTGELNCSGPRRKFQRRDMRRTVSAEVNAKGVAVADVEWNGPEIEALIEGASAAGLLLAAEHLLQVSRTEVPIEEATLERSGVASVDEGDLTAAVSYDTVYAVRQHEELTWRHDEGRKAKYLEDPMNNERDTLLELAAAPIQDALGG